VNPRVRFDDEADAEYRLAGRWYETRREHLGLGFFNAVDATIDPRRCARSPETWLPEGPPEIAGRCLVPFLAFHSSFCQPNLRESGAAPCWVRVRRRRDRSPCPVRIDNRRRRFARSALSPVSSRHVEAGLTISAARPIAFDSDRRDRPRSSSTQRLRITRGVHDQRERRS